MDPQDVFPPVPRIEGLQAMLEDGVEPEVIAQALTWGTPYQRRLRDGRLVGVEVLTYGRARVWVGDGRGYDQVY